MQIEIKTAKECAWRALYLRVNGQQIAHVGVDPNNGTRPVLFGGCDLLWRHFRIRLPSVPWRSNAGKVYSCAYTISQRFWFGVDGRFGGPRRWWRWNTE